MKNLTCAIRLLAACTLATMLIEPASSQTKTVKVKAVLTAKTILQKSIAAMGGDSWASVKSLSLDGYGYQNSIEQSERWEGPYIPGQFSRSIVKNFAGKTAMVRQSTLVYTFKNDATYLFDGGFVTAKYGSKLVPTQQAQELQAEIELSPELVLQKAAASADVRYLKDTTVQQAVQHIVFFKWNGYPVRIFLNAETDMLTAVEVTKPYISDYMGLWGDTRKTTFYSFWMLLGKGLHYPLQQDSYVNGWYKSSFMVNKWELNPTIMPDSLSIPKDLKITDSALTSNFNGMLKKQMDRPAKKIAEGIAVYAGPCNSTVVEQADGLIVIEGPHSSVYTDLLVRKIKAAYPGKKIKALVATSDAWLHIGGIRTYAAMPEIKIYHPYRNKPLLDRLLSASYTTAPDEFAKAAKHSYTLIGVKDSLAIGRGSNKLVLYPYKTETGDRMMMVYFPKHKLLYVSDLYQPKGPKGDYWEPHMELEVYQSIKKLMLPVEQFYGMHSRVIPFTELENDFKGY
jgi:hypothetical protein